MAPGQGEEEKGRETLDLLSAREQEAEDRP